MHKKSDRKLKNLRMAPSSGGKISSKQRKLVPNGAGTEDTAVSRAQGNLTHQKKFTTCNIFSICCIILTAITSSLMYFGLQRTTGHQPQHWASLQHNFSVDYDEIMANRQQSMARHRNNYSTFGIDRRHGLSLEEFFDVYDGKWPVLLTDVVGKWPASNWTRDFFISEYGSQPVSVKAVNGSLSDAVSLALPLELFSLHTQHAQPHQWSYVEDELFIPMRKELRKQLWSTEYLEEDFFHLFPPSIQPWDAMLLWGTAFSRSSLHIDPYNWTGTNAVLNGRKRWKMFPPGQDHLLYVKENQMSGFPLDCFKYNSPIDAFDVDLDKYPRFTDAVYFEFDQLPGELLIIPPGWFHQAFNVEETIAVSGQLMNRNNYRIVLEEILKTGVVNRSSLPENIDLLPADKQVWSVISQLPQEVLDHGKSVTDSVLEHMRLSQTDDPFLSIL